MRILVLERYNDGIETTTYAPSVLIGRRTMITTESTRLWQAGAAMVGSSREILLLGRHERSLGKATIVAACFVFFKL